jgi:hypothetical protein
MKRLVEVAKVLRRFPWMVEVMRQRSMSILYLYMVEVYVARDEWEACLSPDPPKALCTQVGAVKVVRLELAFSRYETYEDKTREVHRQKGVAGIHHCGERI